MLVAAFLAALICYASGISVISTLQHRVDLRNSISEVHNSTAAFFTGFRALLQPEVRSCMLPVAQWYS